MRLITDLEAMLAREESIFRAQLLKEDIARLQKLQVLAVEHADVEAFKKAGMRVGWTQNDMMTHTIADELGVFLEAVHTGRGDDALEGAWREVCKARNEKLIKCL